MEHERIIQALERMVELQEKILRKLCEASDPSLPEPTEWIDSLKVQDILGISRTTLYRLNHNKKLLSRQIGGRYYYSASDIFKLKDQFLK